MNTYTEIKFNKLKDSDLLVYRCGAQNCEPGYTFGPAVRDFYSIHYILKGKGSFTCEGQTFYLQEGEGFLISPGKLCIYSADENDPWSYTWVSFYGFKAKQYLKLAGLVENVPVFKYSRDDSLKRYFRKLVSAKESKSDSEFFKLGYLYLIFHKLSEVNAPISEKDINLKEVYTKKAIDFIEMNYSSNITIAEVAEYVCLDPKYFSSLFKENTGVSPKEFLVRYRMEKACELMKDKRLTIGDIARSVGYNDQLVFSRTFKKRIGVCPKEFRRSQE